MSVSRSEYLLKGVFLGLLLFVAWLKPDWDTLGRVGVWLGGGVGVALMLAFVDQSRRRRGFLAGGLTLPVFLLLEYPRLVYVGVIGGLVAGALAVRPPDVDTGLLPILVGGGAFLGLVLGELRRLKNGNLRVPLLLAVAGGALGGLTYWVEQQGLTTGDRRMVGMTLLVGLPFLYLLTFAGHTEESEVDIALVCASLGVSGYLIETPGNWTKASVLIPIALYFVYATRVLPGLRVFKLMLRGYSHLDGDRLADALRTFRRALQLDPKHELSREAMWTLHRSLDFARLEREPVLVSLLDFPMCLERVASLLVSDRPPTPRELQEAERLLDLVDARAPRLRGESLYYRALAATHGKDIDRAAACLTELLDPAPWEPDDAGRNRVLLPAWQLVLQWHPALKARVGEAQLPLPGRRIEAIAAVERQRRAGGLDEDQKALKTMLYDGLTEDEYRQAKRIPSAEDINYDYIQELGMSLLSNPLMWLKGGQFLRIAAAGVPALAPFLFQRLANAHELRGDLAGRLESLKQIVRASMSLGVDNLQAEQRQVYFDTVQRLAEEAADRGDWDEAIANYQLYAASEKSGAGTMRTLAELYEKKGDVPLALRATEKGLLYAAKDADLLEKKDRYYYSLTPEQLRAIKGEVAEYFDTDYCVKKARSLLDARDGDFEVIAWASHLAELARVMRPESPQVLSLVARSALRRGERDAALQVLEDVREMPPGGGGDEEAWFWACQQLGRLYLDELERPDLAIGAFLDFRKSPKSGADTAYHLGRAYEATGDVGKAKKCYEQVTAYPQHPLVWDARSAIDRLSGQG